MSTRVMIVEDREMISQAIKDMLILSGYEVVAVASNGAEALEKYPETRPDIVLMDLLLPDMNGIEVASRIIQMDREARVLAITATTKEDVLKDCMQAGFKGLVRKPFRMKELLSSLQKVMQ